MNEWDQLNIPTGLPIVDLTITARIRRLFGMLPPGISIDKAIEIARTAATERDFAWIGQIWVVDNGREYRVESNHAFRGVNVSARVDRFTGELLSIKFACR